MTRIFGSLCMRSDRDAEATLRRMQSAAGVVSSADTLAIRGGGGFGIAGSTKEARLVEHDGLVLAIVGHPRLHAGAEWTADPIAIARMIRSSGAGALPALGGDFALAAWDESRSWGLLAIDRIGVRQLVYARLNGALAFASTLDALTSHPGVSEELSPQAIFDYLYFHVCPGPQTIYRGLYRIPPGHYLEFGPSGGAEPRPYWRMRFTEDPTQDFDALKHRFVDLLRDAVASASRGASCGAFLSGGTDSSTVSGMLGRTSGARARTFSIGFDADGYDEMEFARIAVRHFDCDHHEYYVTPSDVVAAASKIAAYYDQPFGNSSAIPAYYCAKLARDSGVERLLAGDGGDELFGGNERYAKQQLLELYQRVPGPLRSLLVEPLVLSTPLFKSLPGLRKLHSFVEQASPPMPLRYESRNLLVYLGIENVLAPELVSAVDRGHPHELLREAHAPYADSSLINQMLGIDLRFTLADNDLPKVTRMCELAGVDVAFPLLDERLIEFSALLPADLKLRGTQLRWFFKEALRDFLPAAIIEKQKHGFGLPVGHWLVEYAPLRDLAAQAIDSLRPHRIVRPEAVDELFGRRLHEHPKFFGTMVWVLMMLGLWLDSRRR
jgi:asparagine synthase (glutamine-hydrolysing)